MLDGHVTVVYTFARPDKRKRDLGNLEKAVSDILVKMGVIQDDSFIQKITLQWGKAPMGCRVELAEASA
jgi:crossover junction endodeoxyribonuclease RusA